jgi:hypothetical protein
MSRQGRTEFKSSLEKNIENLEYKRITETDVVEACTYVIHSVRSKVIRPSRVRTIWASSLPGQKAYMRSWRCGCPKYLQTCTNKTGLDTRPKIKLQGGAVMLFTEVSTYKSYKCRCFDRTIFKTKVQGYKI